MPDKRQHRGPHPRDLGYFHARHWPALQSATADLSWLLSRDYSLTAALKLTGDRYGLHQRQRLAVQRSACSDGSLAGRRQRLTAWSALGGRHLVVDGFNLLMTIEAALGGAIIIRGRDGCYRDMASVHGTFRVVDETGPALQRIGTFLQQTGPPAGVCWLLDAPVSNSGRLAGQIRQLAAAHRWPWQVELVPDPDPVLQQSDSLVISTDSVVLDRCRSWCNLGRAIIDALLQPVQPVPMSATDPQTPGSDNVGGRQAPPR